MTPEREHRIEEVTRHRQSNLCVVLDHVENPHNVGAILRSCDAFGVGAVHLLYTGKQKPRLSEIRGTAMSAAKWLNLQRWNSFDALATHLLDARMAIYPTTLADGAIDPARADLAQSAAIIIGNEREGVLPMWQSVATASLRLPMVGFVQSFNVSVATALVLYETYRQRHSTP